VVVLCRSSATSVTVQYSPTPVVTAFGSAVTLLSGTGTRTYTNRFGFATTTPLTLTSAGTVNSSNLLYLASSVPVDGQGLTWSLASPVQLPGNGPASLFSQLNVFNSSGVFIEGYSSRVDGLGEAFLSSIPGFTNVTIGASNINSLAPVYSSCQAPISFTNGLRVPTQPSTFNGAVLFSYSYFISDGSTYSIQANLTISTSSAFATTKDQLGNPYQTVTNVVGTHILVPTHQPEHRLRHQRPQHSRLRRR
jgi:hypothetical protein